MRHRHRLTLSGRASARSVRLTGRLVTGPSAGLGVEDVHEGWNGGGAELATRLAAAFLEGRTGRHGLLVRPVARHRVPRVGQGEQAVSFGPNRRGRGDVTSILAISFGALALDRRLPGVRPTPD